jgi:hypothetical protein
MPRKGGDVLRVSHFFVAALGVALLIQSIVSFEFGLSVFYTVVIGLPTFLIYIRLNKQSLIFICTIGLILAYYWFLVIN